MTRCLYNPNRERYTPGNGAPRGASRSVLEARQELHNYLDASLCRPLYNSNGQPFSSSDAHARAEQALDGLSMAERVYVELEMQARQKRIHSYEYDALR